MDLLPALLLIGAPLLVPLFLKKRVWAMTAAAGYALYILWGVLLHYSADITEYGTGYGMLIPFYLLFITVLGVLFQKWSDRRRNSRNGPASDDSDDSRS
ncbi:hypothetical protein [Indiicoccus explosivorum]|uniref:hypothetical protein n=1 Tax=Indiicoccus explosivorum TaxID=1917864 RepID=UPI0013905686|nr:hypothetical protein [Indiicoccus explosivorum]